MDSAKARGTSTPQVRAMVTTIGTTVSPAVFSAFTKTKTPAMAK